MALEAPLRASTGNIMSFSQFQDMSVTISSFIAPVLLSLFFFWSMSSLLSCLRCLSPKLTSMCRSRSTPNPESQTLRPTAYVRPHSAHLMSPSSDMVGPSPVTSNGTETTEIEDEEQLDSGYYQTTAEAGGPPQVRDADIRFGSPC